MSNALTKFFLGYLSKQRLTASLGGGGGGRGSAINKPYRYVPSHRMGFLRRFGLKMGTHFAHFGLESGMVFEGTTESRNVFYRFNSKWDRKREKYANSIWI